MAQTTPFQWNPQDNAWQGMWTGFQPGGGAGGNAPDPATAFGGMAPLQAFGPIFQALNPDARSVFPRLPGGTGFHQNDITSFLTNPTGFFETNLPEYGINPFNPEMFGQTIYNSTGQALASLGSQGEFNPFGMSNAGPAGGTIVTNPPTPLEQSLIGFGMDPATAAAWASRLNPSFTTANDIPLEILLPFFGFPNSDLLGPDTTGAGGGVIPDIGLPDGGVGDTEGGVDTDLTPDSGGDQGPTGSGGGPPAWWNQAPSWWGTGSPFDQAPPSWWGTSPFDSTTNPFDQAPSWWGTNPFGGTNPLETTPPWWGTNPFGGTNPLETTPSWWGTNPFGGTNPLETTPSWWGTNPFGTTDPFSVLTEFDPTLNLGEDFNEMFGPDGVLEGGLAELVEALGGLSELGSLIPTAPSLLDDYTAGTNVLSQLFPNIMDPGGDIIGGGIPDSLKRRLAGNLLGIDIPEGEPGDQADFLDDFFDRMTDLVGTDTPGPTVTPGDDGGVTIDFGGEVLTFTPPDLPAIPDNRDAFRDLFHGLVTGEAGASNLLGQEFVDALSADSPYDEVEDSVLGEIIRQIEGDAEKGRERLVNQMAVTNKLDMPIFKESLQDFEGDVLDAIGNARMGFGLERARQAEPLRRNRLSDLLAFNQGQMGNVGSALQGAIGERSGEVGLQQGIYNQALQNFLQMMNMQNAITSAQSGYQDSGLNMALNALGLTTNPTAGNQAAGVFGNLFQQGQYGQNMQNQQFTNLVNLLMNG